MNPADLLLEQLRVETEPKARRALLEKAHPDTAADPRIQNALLWWDARYVYTDKRKRMVQDRFVWLFVMAWAQADERGGKKGSLATYYQEVFGTPELQTAMAADDLLYGELCAAVALFSDTLRNEAPILGIYVPRSRSTDSLNKRVAGQIVGKIMVPLAHWCRGQAYLELVLQALYEGAKSVYPGIQPALLSAIEAIPEAQDRAFLTQCVRDTSLGDF